jgi:hypothetical protein
MDYISSKLGPRHSSRLLSPVTLAQHGCLSMPLKRNIGAGQELEVEAILWVHSNGRL